MSETRIVKAENIILSIIRDSTAEEQLDDLINRLTELQRAARDERQTRFPCP